MPLAISALQHWPVWWAVAPTIFGSSNESQPRSRQSRVRSTTRGLSTDSLRIQMNPNESYPLSWVRDSVYARPETIASPRASSRRVPRVILDRSVRAPHAATNGRVSFYRSERRTRGGRAGQCFNPMTGRWVWAYDARGRGSSYIQIAYLPDAFNAGNGYGRDISWCSDPECLECQEQRRTRRIGTELA